MNNRGQVLVLFIIILPVLLLGCACLIDSSYIFYQKNRLDNINYDVLNSLKDRNDLTEEIIDNLILLNDERIVNDEIVVGDSITIKNHIYVDSVFGKLIGFDEYKVSSSVSLVINIDIYDDDLDNNMNIDNSIIENEKIS